MAANSRICIISCYFGSLPQYFPLWLRSCSYNPDIDFLVFSDQNGGGLPDNVRLVHTTLDRIRQRIEEILQMKVSLERPYKLCDFKPMYGDIFSEYLTGYAYWGHCDIDLIFGQIRPFLERYHLEEYDRFLGAGHLSLYRNSGEVNKRYLTKGGSRRDYEEVYASARSWYFDENAGMGSKYISFGWPFFQGLLMADIHPAWHRYKLVTVPGSELKNYDHQVFFWENGKIYREAILPDDSHVRDEFIYCHFQKRGNLPMENECLKTDGFFISYKGFFPKKSEVSMSDIDRYNPFPGERYERREESRSKWRGHIATMKIIFLKLLGQFN